MKNFFQSKLIYIFLSILLGFSSSCSFFKREENQTLSGQGVVLDGSTETKKLPRIQESSTADFRGVGPEPDKTEKFRNTSNIQKVPVVALILGPGINRVAAHITLLRGFERQNVPIRLISGSGMGAVVAALYANGMTTDMIEWNFYKFFSSSKGLKPYNRKWLEAVDRTLLVHMKTKKIQNSNISLIIPVYDTKKRVVHYLKRGQLHTGLLTNLQLHRGGKRTTFSAPFVWEVYNRRQLEKSGADILVGVDVLGEDIDFVSGDDFLIGVFGKAASRAKRERDSMDLFFELPVEGMPLDSQKDLPGLLQRSLIAGESAGMQIREKIINWKFRPIQKSLESDQDWKAPSSDIDESEQEEL